MKKLITGITVSGNITLGNYIGVIKRLKYLTEEYESYIFVANLHGLTNSKEEINIEEFKKQTKQIAAIYASSGLNLKNSNIFIQSDIPEITELAYIISVHTTLGELNRMTQFKDKSSKTKSKNGTELIPTGLLMYPTLMAADILSFNSNVVPVGMDQKQHIELTRNIATRFNNKYGKTFVIPEPLIEEGKKIMALQNPKQKMSKSDTNQKNTIYVLDDQDTITKKIKSSLTDSENKVKFDIKNKPGISNLMTIYSSLSTLSNEDIEKKYESLGYKEFKEDLIKIIISELSILQKKYNAIVDSKKLTDILNKGSKKAREESKNVLKITKERLGLI